MLITSFSLAPIGFARDPEPATGPIDPLYEDAESAMFFENIPPNTGPDLTVDLGGGIRLIIPSRFAEQEVRKVERMFYLGPGYVNPVVVGLRAGTPDGPMQAFALVYELEGKEATLKTEIPLRQYFDRFEELRLDQDRVLAIYGISGAHFHDLWLYSFKTGKPELLLAQGSAAGVDVRRDKESGNPQIWVGVESWDDPNWSYSSGAKMWNVYSWNGKQFALDAKLSTAPVKSAEERTEEYLAVVKEGMEKAENGDGSN